MRQAIAPPLLAVAFSRSDSASPRIHSPIPRFINSPSRGKLRRHRTSSGREMMRDGRRALGASALHPAKPAVQTHRALGPWLPAGGHPTGQGARSFLLEACSEAEPNPLHNCAMLRGDGSAFPASWAAGDGLCEEGW